MVNAGLLLNQDDFAQELTSTNTFLTFGMGDQIQPRLGANYNLRKGKGDKVYANYGRYYYSTRRAARARWRRIGCSPTTRSSTRAPAH